MGVKTSRLATAPLARPPDAPQSRGYSENLQVLGHTKFLLIRLALMRDMARTAVW